MSRPNKIPNDPSSPNKNIQNTKMPPLNLYIDFTKYRNWEKSVKLKRINFSNWYQNEKHVSATLSEVLFDIFPFVQENILEIMGGSMEHNCHAVEKEALGRAWLVIDEIYENNSFEKDLEIYQLGVTGGVRVFGVLIYGGQHHTFYPLFIDCNHLIYPSKKHNKKDYMRFGRKIK